MMRSALAMVRAIEGAGRNVWEFTPSGTMPVTSARSPATFSTMLVIGATVVTTRRAAAESWVGNASINPSSSARVTLPPAEWHWNRIAMVVWAPLLVGNERSAGHSTLSPLGEGGIPNSTPIPLGEGGLVPSQIQPLSLWERVAEGRVRAPQ